MSAGEAIILVAGFFATLTLWGRYYFLLLAVRRLGAPSDGRLVLALTPALCSVLMYTVLRTVASYDVVSDGRYVGMYFVLGGAWVGAAQLGMGWLGLSARDDVVDRGNGAAAPAVAGALMAFTLCYAGGNIGDGPGWWVVVFAGFLATGGLLLLWAVFERLTGVSELVTVERDDAAGWRLGGLLAAAGLVFGRAVAGDWVSGAATVRDVFGVAWPVLVLLACALLVESAVRPSAERPRLAVTAAGVVPSLCYLLMAVAYVSWRGLPE